MNLNEYISGTLETWQDNPIDLYPKEEYNLRLQKANALIGLANEFFETIEDENISPDELGDILYYVVIGYQKFNIDTLDELITTLNNFVSNIISPTDLVVLSESKKYQLQAMLVSGDYFNNVKKTLFRKGKEFDINFISDLLSEMLFFIFLMAERNNYTIYEIMEMNYDKLHDLTNLEKRGLELKDNEPE
jgi:NTP pyrophosphatase (non-canonical NTP hydrolase)